MKKEYGGYFELENIYKKEYYNYLDFNCARNAFRFLIKKKNIKKVFLPRLNCCVIKNAAIAEKVEISFYDLNNDFTPKLESTDDFVYVVNLYGLLSSTLLKRLKKKFSNMIIDNTHSFYDKSLKDVDTIYNCRKYFGIPDGAYLSTSSNLSNESLDRESSKNFFSHLLGRFETKDASTYYSDFKEYDEYFNNSEVKRMSLISKNILGAIDYKLVKNKRIENFNYLDNKLHKYNKLKFDHEMTFMYPLLTKNGYKLKEYLISKKIYVPTLWPNVLEDYKENSFEYNFVNNIVLLPIDQRYSLDDMESISNIIEMWYEHE